MVYNNKIVAAVKCNGKILRETNFYNEVVLPFGSEYSIVLKNLDARRAVAEVSIDGNDVLDGKRLVIDSNDSTELKGVMIGNMVKNAFKFIQKTKKIQDHRGDKIDDGFICVKFGFERTLNFTSYVYPTIYRTYCSPSEIVYGSSPTSNVTHANTIPTSAIRKSIDSSAPKMDEGITVAGSELRQNFNTSHIGSIEDQGSIIITLKGTNDKDTFVQDPVYVSTKKECPTCGTKSKYSVKFCPECGTNLQA